jgi:hypothetical protein
MVETMYVIYVWDTREVVESGTLKLYDVTGSGKPNSSMPGRYEFASDDKSQLKGSGEVVKIANELFKQFKRKKMNHNQ